MRSIWAKIDDAARENRRRTTANRFFTGLFVTQCFHRIEPRGAISGQKRENAADQKRADANCSHVARDDLCGQSCKLINLLGKNFDAERTRKPLAELVPITDERHSQTE